MNEQTRNPGRSSSFIRRFGRPVNLGSIQLTVSSNERRKYLLDAIGKGNVFLHEKKNDH